MPSLYVLQMTLKQKYSQSFKFLVTKGNRNLNEEILYYNTLLYNTNIFMVSTEFANCTTINQLSSFLSRNEAIKSCLLGFYFYVCTVSIFVTV